jgi:hypothetical protein
MTDKHEDRGPSPIIEYGLIAAMIAILVITVVGRVGRDLISPRAAEAPNLYLQK